MRGAVGIEMLKFEAKKGDFAKSWQKLGGLQPPPPAPPAPPFMIFKFFRSKTTFTIIALKVVTCTPTFARVTEPSPSQEIGSYEQFS